MDFDVWSGLLGGLALFMLGLDVMTRALRVVAGDSLRDLLGRLTVNRFAAVGTGAVVTAALNSSSVTTVLLVGFISAGFLTTAQAIGVVFGANIGSTMTAQIIAFDIGRLALPAIAAGVLVSSLGRRQRTRNLGLCGLGLGLVFFGMGVMSDAMRPLRDDPAFVEALRTLESVPLAVLAGALFTALVQSSAATTAIVMTMASGGLMGLETAIAAALGANIGTCVTAGLATIGKPPDAVRLFLVHLGFNIAGAVVWMPFIGELADAARALSGLFGGGPDVAREIANAHTLFNVANTLLFIGFTPQIARLLQRLVPDRPVAALEPQHLDAALLTVPAMAMEAARLEVARFGREVATLQAGALVELEHRLRGRGDDDAPILAGAPVEATHRLRKSILAYIARIMAADMSPANAAAATDLLQAVELLNSVLEVTATLGRPSLTEPDMRRRPLSPTLAAGLVSLGTEVHRHLCATMDALARQDPATAAAVIAAKQELHATVRRLTDTLFRDLVHGDARTRTGFTGAMADIERISRLHRLVRKIAKLVVRPAAPVEPAPAPAITSVAESAG
ncbi:Na/Pi cotransporter family protein [Azospirillum halopraeferens]|uniref:Na/Pi cotransporter family protein n=1 Tax=Azospirillum halopraeferens TaxID=34010 RepID=UPI0004152872|nr:Na/Pi cotransporter family protein [Azospirillum halopraeferens]